MRPKSYLMFISSIHTPIKLAMDVVPKLNE